MLFALCITLLAAFPLDQGNAIELEDVYQPSSLDIDAKGRLFICDEGNAQVLIYDSQGNLLKTVGRKGQGPGEFQNPLDVAIFENGHFAVSDSIAGNIQLFDADFQFIKRLKLKQMVGRVHALPGNRFLVTRDFGRNIYMKIGTQIDSRFSVYNLEGEQVRSFGTWLGHESPFFAMFLNSGPTAILGDTLIFAGLVNNDLIYYKDGETESLRYPITFEPIEPKSSQKKTKNPDGSYDIQMKTEVDQLCGALAVLPNGELLMLRAEKSVAYGDDVPFERVRLKADGTLIERYEGSYFSPLIAVSPTGKEAYVVHETDEAIVLETWPL